MQYCLNLNLHYSVARHVPTCSDKVYEHTNLITLTKTKVTSIVLGTLLVGHDVDKFFNVGM